MEYAAGTKRRDDQSWGRAAEGREIILVIGMHRSGTSAVTRVLSLCGAALPLHVLPRNFGNPTGYWEPQRAVELNEQFARSNGSSWADSGLVIQLNPISGTERRDFVARVAQFLETGFRTGGPVVIKDPRITVLLPYWLDAARQLRRPVRIVHVFRNPADVAASMHARDGLDERLSLTLWLKYNLIGERDARGIPRFFLAYEQLMNRSEAVLAKCVTTLGLELTADTRASIAEFLAPRLRHFSNTVSVATIDRALREWVSRTYEILERSADGVLRSAELDAIFREYVEAGMVAAAAEEWQPAGSDISEGLPDEP